MKKFKLGLMALALTIGIAGAFASNVKKHQKKLAGFYWYAVDSANKTVGSPVYSNDTKAQALAEPDQNCDDTPAQPICLAGSDIGTLPTGTDVSAFDSDHTILEQDQQ